MKELKFGLIFMINLPKDAFPTCNIDQFFVGWTISHPDNAKISFTILLQFARKCDISTSINIDYYCQALNFNDFQKKNEN